MSVVVVGSSQPVQHTFVIPTEPSSEQASSRPDNSRCLTLHELINHTAEQWSRSAFQSGEEVIFQSGVHFVNGTGKQKLAARDIKGITIRGEPNAIISCLDDFYFRFEWCSNVNISNIEFNNCAGQNVGNHTLFFNKQKGNITLDQIQITNKFGGAIAVFIRDDPYDYKDVQVYLSNCNISTGKTGVYIHQYYKYQEPTLNVYITDTIFVSCLTFYGRDHNQKYSVP